MCALPSGHSGPRSGSTKLIRLQDGVSLVRQADQERPGITREEQSTNLVAGKCDASSERWAEQGCRCKVRCSPLTSAIANVATQPRARGQGDQHDPVIRGAARTPLTTALQ